jgi:hypothetical protein
MFGRQTTPRTAGLLIRPLAPISAHGGEHRWGEGGPAPGDGPQVHARHPEAVRGGRLGLGGQGSAGAGSQRGASPEKARAIWASHALRWVV